MNPWILRSLAGLLLSQGAAAASFDFEAEAPPPEFSFAGDLPWSVDDSRSSEGMRSLRSGGIGNSQTSDAILNLVVSDASHLNFAYFVDAEWYDPLHIYVDGALVATLRNTSEWATESINLSAGEHEIRWSFDKDSCCNGGADAVWIDDVRVQSVLDPDERVQLDWNRTDASWGFQPSYPGLVLHDVTGDGHPEVIAAARQGTVGYWYVATWRSGRLEKTYISAGYADGINDLTVFEATGGQWQLGVATDSRLYIHNLPGLELYAAYSLPEQTRRIAIADLDGDGDLDLVYQDGGTYVPYPSGCPCTVIARDLSSGEELWQFQPGNDDLWDIAVADLTDAPGAEVVLATTPGFLLSGATGDVLWEYPFGFGRDIALGNFDDDAGTEFASPDGAEVGVYDPALESPLWSLPSGWDTRNIAAHDVTGDGRDEIFVGDGQWGQVHVYSPVSRTELHAVDNPEHGVGRIAAGDVTGDGVIDIVFGAGESSSGADALLLGDMSSATPAWMAVDESVPVNDLRVADVDNDGGLELVYATRASESGYESGRLHVLDAATFAERFVTPPFANGNDWLGTGGLDVAQLDQDAALEIVVGTADIRDPIIEIYDGSTGALQRSVPMPSTDYGSAAAFPRVLGNDRVVIVQDNKVKERLLSDGTPIWESVSLQQPPIAHAVGNVDGDAALESVVLTTGGHLVSVDLSSHLFDWLIEIPDAAGMAIDPGRHEILIAVPAGIQRYDAVAETLVETYPTLSPAVGVWFANQGARHLLFAATENHTIEIFDASTGARLAAEPMRGPGLGRGTGAVTVSNAGGTATMWAVSDYAVHQFGAELEVRSIFEDGFE